MYETTATGKRQRKNGNGENGQRENSATKIKTEEKRTTQNYCLKKLMQFI